MDARALAVSALVHVCAAGALGRTFAPAISHENASATAHAAPTIDVEVPDSVEVDAPKPRPNGTLAGSDRAGVVRASGPNRATDGERGEETPSTTADARFGMVALVDSSHGTSGEQDATWAPRAGGGADGMYAGAVGEGLATSGLGIGAAHDHLGVGLAAIGARGSSGGDAPGAPSTARAWSDGWQGVWSSYNHHPRWPVGPHIVHPTRLAPMGPLDGDVIVRAVRRQSYPLLVCYTRALEAHADLDGELRVDFMTARDGTVVGAKDGGGPAGYDALFVACMTRTFRSFTFPEAPAPTRVTYAMQLRRR